MGAKTEAKGPHEMDRAETLPSQQGWDRGWWWWGQAGQGPKGFPRAEGQSLFPTPDKVPIQRPKAVKSKGGGH